MRIGRWSLALKQGVVLKLARSVVVPGGLKWVERSQSHTYNSQPLAFTHLPLAPSLSVTGRTFSSRWISHKNHRYLRAAGEHHPQKCFACVWVSLDHSHLGCWSAGSSGLSAACPGCAAAFLTNRSECWGLVLSRWVTNNSKYMSSFMGFICVCAASVKMFIDCCLLPHTLAISHYMISLDSGSKLFAALFCSLTPCKSPMRFYLDGIVGWLG